MKGGAGRPSMPCTRLNSLDPSSLSLHSAHWITAGHGNSRRHNGDLIQFVDAVDPPIVYLIVHFFAETSPKIGIFFAAGQVPGASGSASQPAGKFGSRASARSGRHVLRRAGHRDRRPDQRAGRHDPQDGLNHRVRRAARGGRVAVSGDPAPPIRSSTGSPGWIRCHDVSGHGQPPLSRGRPRRGGIKGGMSWQRLTQCQPTPQRRPTTPSNPGRQRPPAGLGHPPRHLCRQMLSACSPRLPH